MLFVHRQHDTYTSQERGHGRTEQRSCSILIDPPGFAERVDWPGLRVIGLYYCERRQAGKPVAEELRYFIGSKPAAQTYGQALRGHWSIENNLHWQLDVSFSEDQNRVRERRAAESLALVRRLTLMLLKRHPARLSLARKLYAAALETTFLEEILCGKT